MSARCEVCRQKFAAEGTEKTCPVCAERFKQIYGTGASPDPKGAAALLSAGSNSSTEKEAIIMSTTTKSTTKFNKIMRAAPVALLKDGEDAASPETIIDRLSSIITGTAEPSAFGFQTFEAARSLLERADKEALASAEAEHDRRVASKVEATSSGDEGYRDENEDPGEPGESKGEESAEGGDEGYRDENEDEAGNEGAPGALSQATKGVEVVVGRNGKPIKATYQWKMRQLSPARQVAVKVRNMREAAIDYANEAAGWNVEAAGHRVAQPNGDTDLAITLGALGKNVVMALDAFVAALESLPADYKPKKTDASSSAASDSELKPGQKVQLREKVRAGYTDVLANTAEILAVRKVAGSKIVCVSDVDGQLIFARKELQLAPTV